MATARGQITIASINDGEDAHEVQPNLLLRTVFDRGLDFVREAWATDYEWAYVGIDRATDTVVQGRRSVRINASAAPAGVDFRQDVYARLKPGTWYTLSFHYYATQAFVTYIYSGSSTATAIDQDAGIYVDGAHVSDIGTTAAHMWKAAWRGERHTYAFRTADTLSTAHAYVVFRAPQGVQVALCMPKLEEGLAATAYMAHESDLVGESGNDAVAVSLTPQSVILTQSDSGDYAIDLANAVTAIRVTKGSVDKTADATIVSAEPSTFSYNGTTYNSCGVSVSGSTVKITSVSTRGNVTVNGKTIKNYIDQGYVDVVVQYDGVTYPAVRFAFYCNLLGTWQETVVGDVNTALATHTKWVQDELGNYVKQDDYAAYVRSASENISTLTSQLDGKVDTSSFNQRASSIEATVEGISGSIIGSNLLTGLSDGDGWTHDEAMFNQGRVRFYSYSPDNLEGEIVLPQIFLPVGTYTLSAASVGPSVTAVNVECYSTDGEYVFDDSVAADGGFSLTFSIAAPVMAEIRITTDSDVFYIERPKIESGKKATPFSPESEVTKSRIRQTAESIKLEVVGGLQTTGIDIERGTIKATTDNFTIHNSSNEQVLGVDADGNLTLSGVVKAKTLFRSYQSLMLSHGSTDTFASRSYVCDLSLYMQGKFLNNDGSYSALAPAFTEMPDIFFVGCRTPYSDSSAYALHIPRPENYKGRLLDIYGEQNVGLTVNASGGVTGYSYAIVNISCNEYGKTGPAACFAYPFSTTARDNVFYFNDRYYGADVHGGHIRLLSAYVNGRWLWVVISVDNSHALYFDYN